MSSTISVLPESSKLSQAIWRTLKPSSSFLTFGSKIDNLNYNNNIAVKTELREIDSTSLLSTICIVQLRLSYEIIAN